MEILEEMISSSLTALEKVKSTGFIDSNMLWILFSPGELVYSGSGLGQAFRVLSFIYVVPKREDPYWRATCEFVDWNGSSAGYGTTTFHLADSEKC